MPGPKDPSEANKREASRYPVLRQGKIKVGEQTVYCAIHDLSMTGAKLRVKLPKRFELIIDGLHAVVLAELKWQNVEYVGVAFPEALSTADINAARLRARLGKRGHNG